VRACVARLHGSLHVASEPGRGTTFTLHVPLATAIGDTPLLRVGHSRTFRQLNSECTGS